MKGIVEVSFYLCRKESITLAIEVGTNMPTVYPTWLTYMCNGESCV